MKAVILDGFGGSDVLKIDEVEKPSPNKGQVLVKVKATSVNRPDLVQREGKYPPPPGDSEILGLEVASVIEELGEGVYDWKIGDKVISLVGGGGYAEYTVAWSEHLIPIPESLSFEEAACICESYITAFLNVFLLGKLENGQKALFHGGGGGVNTAAVQICKALYPDVTLFVTTAPEKVDRVKELGADYVINFKETPDFSNFIKEKTNKKGVNLILDHIGANYLQPNMNSLSYEGKLVIIGVTSGIKAEINLALMMVKRQVIIGSVLRSRPVVEKAEIIQEFRKQIMPAFANKKIIPIIERVFPVEQVADAHKMMEEDKHFGKIVLKLDT